MKKIKQTFSKNKLKRSPKMGLLLHIEQRPKIARLMIEWYRDVTQDLSEVGDFTLYMSSKPNPELKAIANEHSVHWIESSAGSQGERLNQGISALKEEDLDAVIHLSPGDFLTQDLLNAYCDHIKQGGLFAGLLDEYLFDPNELKCMYWARHEYHQGIERICDIGWMISTQILNALKWKVWPSQVETLGGSLHLKAMKRFVPLFSKCPKDTCLLKTMEKYGGRVLSLKSEFGRALFEEKNWQRQPGLQFADFEVSFEESISEEWIERLSDFDERLRLDILIEEGGVEQIWRSHYDFSVYKFLPYAEVRLNLISSEERPPNGAWTTLVSTAETAHDRWNDALEQIERTDTDLVIFSGKGSLVDLKTIEHYLIYIFQNGARFLSAHNFFLASIDERQGFFWKGTSAVNFEHSLGFGTCLHRDILDRVGWRIFGENGLISPDVKPKFDAFLHEEGTRSQRVLFQCAAHKLGLISFDTDGAIGFEGRISLEDLKPVNLVERLPEACYQSDTRTLLTLWLSGEELSSTSHSSSSTRILSLGSHSNPLLSEDSMSNSMSPLERAKALLSKAQEGETDSTSSSSTESPVEAQTSSTSSGPPPTLTEENETAPLSPLERAKALLNQSQSDNASIQAESAPSQTESALSQESAPEPMTALERAKALLKGSEILDEAPTSSVATLAESAPSQESAPKPMTALERAKALLKGSETLDEMPTSSASTQAESTATETAPVKTNIEDLSPIERAKALLQRAKANRAPEPDLQEEVSEPNAEDDITQTLKNAEALIQHLKTQAETIIEIEGASSSKSEEPSPADLICEQAEACFGSGEVDRAMSLLESALLVDPNSIRALNDLGVISVHQGEPWKALSFLLFGLLHDPDDPSLVQNLSDLFESQPDMRIAQKLVFG